MFDPNFANLCTIYTWIHNAGYGLHLWLTDMQMDMPLKIFLMFCIAYFAGHIKVLTLVIGLLKKKKKEEISDSFRPELPRLLTPPSADEPVIQEASRKLEERLQKLYAGGLVQGLTVSVVTADGPIFSKSYGTANTEETDPEKRRNMDENTIFRISSCSKLFTTLKLWMLKEKGAIAWYVAFFSASSKLWKLNPRDDDIKKYLPQFSYAPGSWEQHLKRDPARFDSPTEPITLRQIASHIAGIPRDFPPPQIPEWPKNMDGAGLPHYHTTSIPTEDDMLAAIKSYPLSNIPYFQPLYSNTGFALLGKACLIANSAYEGPSAPSSFPELIRRDIFEPLGMSSSSFHLTDENKIRIAVASTDNDDLVSKYPSNWFRT